MSTDNRKIEADLTLSAAGFKAGINEAKAAASDLGNTLDTAAAKGGKSIDNLGAKAADAANATERASRSMEQSLQRQIAALSAGAKGTSDFYRVLIDQRGLDSSRFAPLLATLDSLKAKTENATHATDAHTFSMGSNMAKMEMMRVAHDAAIGSYTRMVSSALVLANATGLTAVAFSLAAIPLAALAIAIGSVALAYYKGSQENDAYRKALLETGNAAGTTVGQMQLAAQTIANTTSVTQHAAAAAIAALGATGAVAGSQMQRFGQIAAQTSQSTGQAVGEIAKNFADLGNAPLAASVKLNDSLHYLTLSTYEQIKALEQQGHAESAALAAQNAYADAMGQRNARIKESLGYIEAAWEAVATAGKKGWNAMLGIGRTEQPETVFAKKTQELADLQARLAGANAHPGSLTPDELLNGDKLVAKLKAQLAPLQEINKLKDQAAQRDASDAALVQKKIEWDKTMAANATNREKQTIEMLAYQNKYGQLLSTQTITQKQFDQGLADIAQRYKDNTGIATAKAARDKEVAEIDKALAQQVDAYAKSNGMLDQLHTAGVISDKSYYDAKRANLADMTAAEVAAYDKEISTLQKTKLTGADKETNDKKIIETQAKKSKAIQDGADAISAANAKEAESIDALIAKYDVFKAAAQDAIDAASKGYSRSLAAQGMSTREAAYASGANQVTDAYTKRINTTQDTLDKTPTGATEKRAELQKEIDNLQALQAIALGKWDEYWAKLIAGENDATLGRDKAMKNYADSAGITANNVGKVYADAFKGMEDAMVSWVQTGTLSSKTLADAIIADLVRIAVQQSVTKPLAQGVASSGGLLSFASSFFANGGVMSSSGPLPMKAYANGGVADSPQLAVFGEGRMNEAYVPLPDGRTIPVTMAGGSSGTTIHQPININAPNAGPETVAQIKAMMPGLIAKNAKVVEAVIRQAMVRKGGKITA